VDGSHGEEIEVARREQDRNRVVVAGVAIDQDLVLAPVIVFLIRHRP
jgi:hypothetical protein